MIPITLVSISFLAASSITLWILLSLNASLTFLSVSYNANQYEFIVMLVSDFMLSNFYFASVLV